MFLGVIGAWLYNPLGKTTVLSISFDISVEFVVRHITFVLSKSVLQPSLSFPSSVSFSFTLFCIVLVSVLGFVSFFLMVSTGEWTSGTDILSSFGDITNVSCVCSTFSVSFSLKLLILFLLMFFKLK